MSTKISSQQSLNLLQLKEQLDEVVFNYIDTSQKWGVAHAKIEQLLKAVVQHFDQYVKANGELPKENTYWVLFLNLSYKLIYFHTITGYHGNVLPNKERTVELLILSAKCIPNVQSENHAEFLSEIAQSLETVIEQEGKQAEFEKEILQQNNRPCDCFESFLEATKYYLA